MKSSRYNIVLPADEYNKHIVFNGVSKKFFFISSANTNALISLLENPDLYVFKKVMNHL